jgi:hypothetical protein
MRKITISILFFTSVLFAACGGKFASSSNDFNPRDTVNVPEELTGEDSIAYIEDAILHSPITAEDLLSLGEVHWVEEYLFNYNNTEKAKEDPGHAKEYMATHRDSAAIRLANRFMRMWYLVNKNGKANDKLQWATAVNSALDTFRVAVPGLPKDSTLNEIPRVVGRFSSLTQSEMNFQCYLDAKIDYYQTIEAYKQWLQAVPSNIKTLAQKEFEAWHDLNDARFALWEDVSYRREWYSMKPMEIEGYFQNLSMNRRAELEIERDIILQNKPYQQKGKTVTAKQWEQWITENSVPEDIDFLKEMKDFDYIPSDSLVSVRVNALKSTFSQWLAVRQEIAEALPEEQGKSYDNLTTDMHSRFIGRLASIIPFEDW